MIYNHFLGINDAMLQERALVFHDHIYSSEEIRKKLETLKVELTGFGITQQHRLGILIGNKPLFVVALLSVLKLQASAVLFSTHFKKYELENYINDSSIQYIISDDSTTNLINQLPFPKKLILDDPDSKFGCLKVWEFTQREAFVHLTKIPEDWMNKECTLQFTSGVGGRSKIVPRTYYNVLDEITNYVDTLELTSKDIVVCPAPFFHAYGLINGFLAPFYKGATVILIEKFIPNNLVQLIKKFQPTIFIGVPFMYDMLSKTFLKENTDFSSLRICFSAGGKLSTEIARKFENRFGIRINQQYGSTETGTMSVNLYKNGFEDVNSVGQSLPGRKIKIVNETNREVPIGEEGEIIILSQGTTSGYLHQDKLNQQKFKEGWYYTGDIGRMDNQENIFITGRKISFINVAGLKVDPFEVENVLKSHPSIKECVVVGKLDKYNHKECVKAIIVCEDDIKDNMTSKKIINFCKERLADYKIPREIVFTNELPKSPTGKILMKYLVDKN